MIKPQKIERIIVICAFCFIFCQATTCSKGPDIPPPKVDPADSLEGMSEQLTASVYIDCTGSMEGFVCPSTATNYIQTLRAIESVINTGWKDARVRFFKFGKEVRPLADRQHLKALGREFYKDSEISSETHIDRVINSAGTGSKGSLTIIVTDLFQDDGDVSVLTDAITKKCIKENRSIGVLGIRSQYDGIVCEVGIQSYSFRYITNDADPRSFRPFYLIILGTHTDVENCFEQLKQKLPFVSKDTFVIFSRHLVHPLASFEGGSIDEIQGLAEVTNIILTNSEDYRIKQFVVRKDSDVGLTATLKYNLLRYTAPFEVKKLEARVAATQYDTAGSKFQDSKEAAKSLNVEKITSLKDGITLTINLTPTTLPGDGIYCYEITMRPSRDAFNIPEWCKNWDMDSTKIDLWKKNPKSFDGSRTLNLKMFVNDLLQKTTLIHEPKIGRVYCYFKK